MTPFWFHLLCRVVCLFFHGCSPPRLKVITCHYGSNGWGFWLGCGCIHTVSPKGLCWCSAVSECSSLSYLSIRQLKLPITSDWADADLSLWLLTINSKVIKTVCNYYFQDFRLKVLKKYWKVRCYSLFFCYSKQVSHLFCFFMSTICKSETAMELFCQVRLFLGADFLLIPNRCDFTFQD